MAVVIYSEELGVYLGSCMGMGFWSKLDPVGQPCAVTFPTEEAAREHVTLWDCEETPVVRFVEVVPDNGEYASVQACVQSGLPGWLDEGMEAVNTLPV